MNENFVPVRTSSLRGRFRFAGTHSFLFSGGGPEGGPEGGSRFCLHPDISCLVFSCWPSWFAIMTLVKK